MSFLCLSRVYWFDYSFSKAKMIFGTRMKLLLKTIFVLSILLAAQHFNTHTIKQPVT